MLGRNGMTGISRTLDLHIWPMLLLIPRSIRAPIQRSLLASASCQSYATSCIVLEDNEADLDCLDISGYGRYSLVLPDDPTREGVAHINPTAVPEHTSRPLYARHTHVTSQGLSKQWPTLAMDSERHRPRLKRNMPSEAIKEKIQRMKPAGSIAGLALLAAENIIKARARSAWKPKS